MKLALFPYYGDVFLKNKVFNTNNGDNIFFGLKEKLAKDDIEINTYDVSDLKKVDVLIFCDVPYFWEIDKWKSLLFSRKKKILFCFESPLVKPMSHLSFFFSFFDKVYTWNDKLVNNRKIFKFYLPVLENNLDTKAKSFKSRKLICLINNNKHSLFILRLMSPFKIDLYPKRIEGITYFEENIPNDFDLYGRGWEGRISNKGSIKRDASSKVRTLSEYKFCLCFENCIADGYLSEKIMDAFKARVVPIYYGSPNVNKYIPTDSYIDFRKFKNFKELTKYIQSINEQQFTKYIKSGEMFLKSKEFKNGWLSSSFKNKILEAISS